MIYCKVLIVFHIVNIRPDCIKRYIINWIILYDFFKFICRVITPSALMPTKSPLRSQNWCPYDFMILFGNFIWIFTEHKINISNPSSCIACYINNPLVIIIFDPPILCIRQISENSKPSIVFRSCHIKWMSTIHIISRRLASFNWIWLISWPKTVYSIVQE